MCKLPAWFVHDDHEAREAILRRNGYVWTAVSSGPGLMRRHVSCGLELATLYVYQAGA